jgi:hypothetical protein
MFRPKALNLSKSPSPLRNTREDLEFDELSEKYMENMKKGTLSPENTKNEQTRTNSIRKYRVNTLARLEASRNLFLPNSEGSEKYGPYPLDPRLNKLQKRAIEEVKRRNESSIPARLTGYGVEPTPPAGGGANSPPAGAGANSPPAGGGANIPPVGLVNASPRKKKTTRRLRKNRRTRKRNTRR